MSIRFQVPGSRVLAPAAAAASPAVLLTLVLLVQPATGNANPETAEEAWQPHRTSAPSLDEWDSLSRWHQMFWWKPVAGHRDRVIQFADRLIAREPDDLVANLLAGQALSIPREWTPADSIAVAAVLQLAEEEPSPGHRAKAAGIRLGQRSDQDWRDSITRTLDSYEAAGRAADAVFCTFLRFTLRFAAHAPEVVDADLEELRQRVEATGDPLDWALYRLQVGTAMYRRNYRDSLAPREEALALLAEHAPGTYMHARALVDLGSTHRRLGNADPAVARLKEAVEIARAIDEAALEASAHQGIGQVIRRRGDAAGALKHYAMAQELLLAVNDTRRVVVLELNQRPLLHQLGRFAEARALAAQTLARCRHRSFPNEFPDALDGMGSEEALVGRLDTARVLFEEAIQAAKDAGVKVPVAVYVHLATLLIEVRDYEGAEVVIDEGLELAQRTGASWGEFFLKHVLATAMTGRDRHVEALAITDALLDPAQQIDPRSRTFVARSRAGCLSKLGRFDEAIALCDSLTADLDGDGDVQDPVQVARVLHEKTTVLLAADRPDEALEPMWQALDLLERTGDESLIHVIHLELGRALSRAGSADEARPYLELGLERVEEINSGLTVGEERTGHFARWYEDYVALADAYLQTGDHDDVFRTLERGRSREMRRALHAGTSGVQAQIGPVLASELAGVEGELFAVQSSLVEQYSLDAADRRDDLEGLEERADQLKRRRSEIVRRVEREQPHFARAAGWLPEISLTEFQVQLADDQLVLATMVGGARTLVFEIERNGFRGRSIPWGEEEIRDRVSAATDGLQETGNAWEVPARELGEALLAGLPDDGHIHTVFVLADGPLHRLPFEILPVGAGEGPLLIETVDVAYETSATLLGERLSEIGASPQRTDLPPECRLLAFGDPSTGAGGPNLGDDEAGASRRGGLPVLRALPHAREEVKLLASLVDGSCVRLGEEATESEFFRRAPSASVIHLAAHAYVDDRHPRYSGIVLAAEGAEDGIVQGFEVVRADLHVDLVILSACDTGRGRWLRGEGLIGLSRAFRIAGAKSLVVSLWEVEDAATAEFMGRFYERLLQGHSLARALRETKLSFRAAEASPPEEGVATRGIGRRSRNPSDRGSAWWSAFVLIGPGDSPYR